MATPDGDVLQRKLGHKRRHAEDDPTAVWHTSLYLDKAEFELLSTLPGRTLTKTRWIVDIEGRPGAVDVFAGNLAGLILLEVDPGERARLTSFNPPAWAGPEVSDDEAFTGSSLAGLDADALEAILAPYW